MVDMQTCRRQQRRWWGVLAVGALMASGTAQAHQGIPPELLERIPEGVVLAPTPGGLIAEGMRLFMQETFRGNGRTCVTCHRLEDNLAISPEFIRTQVPSTDPLFIAETNPNLRELEIPTLMREHGLILENLDGLDQTGVMRGVPHTLGLAVSVTPPGDFPLDGATGWSGDGAPTVRNEAGTLRLFALGAVVQHFPQTLDRRQDRDFRLPTRQELRALEAFQRFTGRSEEIAPITTLDFSDDRVDSGRALFLSAPTRMPGITRSCNGCHGNAGANNSAGENNNFDTGVRLSPNAPACNAPSDRIVEGDGGFGAGPEFTATIQCANGRLLTVPFRGDGEMNTPSLIEAADTGPFFHNNSAETIEEAVEFYTSDTFNASPAGNQRAFVLGTDQINQVGAFLRALNADENIRSSIEYIQFALSEPRVDARAMVSLAAADTQDAIEVLTEGPFDDLFGADVVGLLEDAHDLVEAAARAPRGFPGPRARRPGALVASEDLEAAISLMEQARDLMLENGG